VDSDFPLNHPAAASAAILVAGENFGCGSSREHAAWALTGLGLQAIVARSFADIFRANAMQNGLLPVVVSKTGWQRLETAMRELGSCAPVGPELAIDVPSQTITLPGESVERFEIDGFAKRCLLDGTDTLGYLLSEHEAITAYEQAHPSPISRLSIA
jgi:3-isopropylmalate/(R)-2-methylmalate dehydratase small subunit